MNDVQERTAPLVTGRGASVQEAAEDDRPLVYADEVRLFRCPDGCVWAEGWGGYSFLSHLLRTFSSVTVVARLQEVPAAPAGAVRCDGPGVRFHAVPYYVGPAEYVKRAWQVGLSIRRAYRRDAVYLLRSPSFLGSILGGVLKRRNHPFGLLVTADPELNFADGSNDHRLRRLFRWKYARDLRRLSRDADGVAYVTRSYLQGKYPARAGALTTCFSGVELGDEWFAAQARNYRAVPDPLRIVAVGSFVQLYKGQDVLLRSLARCSARGLRIEARLIGEGRHRSEMEDLARELGLADQVVFTGALPFGAQIREHLDRADLFVAPSRSEGLPRALLEAMARGLPCVGSAVGGIPEVLGAEALTPPGDEIALSERIRGLAADPRALTRMSRENLETSRQFRFSTLLDRREQFYRFLLNRSREWQASC